MTAVVRVIVWASCVIALALILAACITTGDCGRVNEIRSSPYAAEHGVVLSREHPMAEQRVTVHLNAAALPAGASMAATLLVLPADDTTALPSPSAPSLDQPIRPFEVTFIREDTGTVVPATAAWDEHDPDVGRILASIPIDCPAGIDCARVYRIRVSAQIGSDGEVPVSWIAQARVAYEGIREGCGSPRNATADLEATPPTLLPSQRVTFAEPIAREEDGGPIALRHLTVTTDRAPTSASVRVSVVVPGSSSEQDPAWRQWIRVFADDATTPLADTLVGARTYTARRGGTLDVPVLADCPHAGTCRRGYWVVFQNFAATPRWAGWGPDTPPPSLGRMTWTASATGTFDEDVIAPGLNVRIDEDVSPGAGVDRVASGSAADLTISGAASPTAVDITFDVPERPAGANGLDAFGRSVAVVHVQASGKSLQTRLDGEGAGPLTGYANGDGTINLVAHPLDGCPASGPCSAVITLLAGGTLPFLPSEHGSGVVDVAVDLVGAPAGATITIGDPYLLPTAPQESDVPVVPVFILIAGGVLLLSGLLVRRARAARRP